MIADRRLRFEKIAIRNLQFSKLGDDKMEQQLGLNVAGTIFLVAAWGFILATTIFCFKRVLGAQSEKK